MDAATTRSLEIQAIDLLGAVHRSIDWTKVNPRDYWDRLPATVRVAASTTSSLSRCVERVLSMLQVGSAPLPAATVIDAVLVTVGGWPGEQQREMMRLLREEPAVLCVRLRVRLDREKQAREADHA